METFTSVNTTVAVTQTSFSKIPLITLYFKFKLNKLCNPCSVVFFFSFVVCN